MKNIFKTLILVLIFISFTSLGYCAESVSFSLGDRNPFTGEKILTIAYETAADGSLATATRISSKSYSGKVIKIQHIPGASALSTGVADITLDDDNGGDIAGGTMEDINTTDTKDFSTMVGAAFQHYPLNNNTITLGIASNSQASATGTIKMTIR